VDYEVGFDETSVDEEFLRDVADGEVRSEVRERCSLRGLSAVVRTPLRVLPTLVVLRNDDASSVRAVGIKNNSILLDTLFFGLYTTNFYIAIL
jgi:hypothetical protein